MRLWSILEACFLAIPFYFLWNYFAPIYAPNLPELYRDIPFWHAVGLFALVGTLRALLSPGYGFWGCHSWKKRC